MPFFGGAKKKGSTKDLAADPPADPKAAAATAAAYDDAAGAGFDTIMLHSGHKLDTDNRARAVPIVQTTSFGFKSSDHGGALFGLAELGPIYTRIMNPTSHVLEYRIAELEGAACPLHGDYDNAATLPSALVTSSGQSAQIQALLTFMQQGDNFLCAGELYGGTYSQFKHTLKAMGIEARFFDITKPEEIEALSDENTKAIYCETISNPSFNVPDFEVIAGIAAKLEVPFMVDNTFGMCGYTCRPLKWGANIVTSSCTKWIGGHGTTIGGVIVDGSNFNWGVKKADGSLKFPLVAGEQPSYHNLCFWKHPVFGGAYDEPAGEGAPRANTCFVLCARVKTLRDVGACQSPFNSFMLIQGLETLSLRCKAHTENANAVAAWLESHDKVAWVSHASLASHPSHERAKKYFRPGTFGAVLSFGIKGSSPDEARAAGAKFINSVKLASHLANVGDAKTLVIHPGSTTHQQLSTEEQLDAGVKPEMVRVSVGFESLADILADFDQALST